MGKRGRREAPAPPSALCLEGGPRAGLGNARHDGRGNKADYCPPERGLVLGHRGTRSQPFNCVNGWLDGWATVWEDAGCPV